MSDAPRGAPQRPETSPDSCDWERRFSALAGSLDAVAWTVGPDGTFGKAGGGGWADLTGLSPEQSAGMHWRAAFPPEELGRWVEAWDRAEGSSFEIVARLGNPGRGDFSRRTIRCEPIRDDRGAVVEWVASATVPERDSEQKATELALREADRRKDEFLAMLAHELRNPLAAINSAMLASSRGGTEEDRVWSGEIIERQVEHLARLIDDLLDVSRITRGKIQLRTESIDARKILDRAVEAVRPFVASRGHRLDVSIAPGANRLMADPTRVQQIVVNLLTNAAKYTEGEGQIGLLAAPEGPDLVIRVRDNGVGIAPEMLPRVFDLFAQVERSLDRSEGGLGIGLTLVRTLAEMHGGSVSSASRGLGLGSEFVVRLPLLPAAEASMVRPASPRAVQPGKARASRVLVVDDNVDSVKAMARLLVLSGHDVQTAHDGRIAVDLARAYLPHAVLLDIGLPGMDGYAVAEHLRADPELAGVLLVAISGYGREQDRERSRGAGFDHHMVKPIDYDRLLDLLGRD